MPTWINKIPAWVFGVLLVYIACLLGYAVATNRQVDLWPPKIYPLRSSNPVSLGSNAAIAPAQSPADSPKVPQGAWELKSAPSEWAWANEWINDHCKPMDLSGIQFVSPQTGYGAPYDFKVYCRHDNADDVQYELKIFVFKGDADLSETALTLARDAAIKLGPVYYSGEGHGGGLWYIVKLR